LILVNNESSLLREEAYQAMASIDREQLKADWARRGFSSDLWIDSPGQRWEDFTHATDELVLVLEGNMEFEIAGRLCHPEIGEEMPIPAGAVHSARNIGATTARWLYGYKK
jgi:mannose-6-phosphate isomerase-like protein (cupin superfamily)